MNLSPITKTAKKTIGVSGFVLGGAHPSVKAVGKLYFNNRLNVAQVQQKKNETSKEKCSDGSMKA